jgi:IS30 family transposase
MAYSRVTREERNHIYRWRQAGLGVRAIADRLARAASSISRELARNTGQRGYRPKFMEACLALNEEFQARNRTGQ